MDNVDAMNALKVAEQGASVGGSRLEETTNAIAGAWRVGIKGAQNFSQAMGTLNAIVGAGNLRMEDLNSALGTGILVSAKTFGVSLTSVGAALALLTSQGQPATQSATRLRMAIAQMGAPTSKAAEALKAVGLSTTDLATALRRGGIVEAVGLLKEHLEGLSKIKQAQILSAAFGGARTGTTIMALVQGYGALIDKQKQIIANSGKFGAAVIAQAGTAAAKWAHFKSVLETVGITIGDKLLPAFTRVVEWVGRLATSFSKPCRSRNGSSPTGGRQGRDHAPETAHGDIGGKCGKHAGTRSGWPPRWRVYGSRSCRRPRHVQDHQDVR
jgi:TP901 family phage tail tape measure protein